MTAEHLPELYSTAYGFTVLPPGVPYPSPETPGGALDFSDPHRLDSLQLDSGAIASILLLAHVRTLGDVGKPELRTFETTTDYDLSMHIEILKRYLESGPVNDTLQLRKEIVHLIGGAITHDSMDHGLAFELCLPHRSGRFKGFDILKSVLPEFDRMLSAPLTPAQWKQLDLQSQHMSFWLRRTMHHLIQANKPIPQTVGNLMIETISWCQDKQFFMDPPPPEFSLKDVFQTTSKIYEFMNPAEWKKNQLERELEFSLITGRIGAAWHSYDEIRMNQRKALERTSGKLPKESMKSLLATKELLVHPKDYGLTIDWDRTRLARADMDQPLLDPTGSIPAIERRRAFQRVLVVTKESIVKNPEGFSQYQRALVRTIARRLGIPLDIPPNQPLPIPLPVHAKPEVFREQVQLLRDQGDWQYLLLYPEVQKIFFEHLPYCDLPPTVRRTAESWRSVKSSERDRLFFAWEVPTNHAQKWHYKPVFNGLPFFNHWDQAQQALKTTVPGRLIFSLMENGAIPVIVHGTTRGYYGNVDWDLVSSDSYMPDTKRAPRYDVDTLVLAPHVLELWTIGDRVINQAKRYKNTGVRCEISRGLSMRYTVFIDVSKYTEYAAPMTLVQAIHGWMGRDPTVRTDVLPLALLSMPRLRTFGIIPAAVRIHGVNALAAKPVDIFNALTQYLKPKGLHPYFDVISMKDAYPKSSAGAWLLLRTMGDTIAMRAELNWESYRNIAFGIFKKWHTAWSLPQQKGGWDSSIKQDLDQEARKALLVAFRKNALETLELLTYKGNLGTNEIGMCFFFPNIKGLRENSRIWEALKQILSRQQHATADHLIDALAELLSTSDFRAELVPLATTLGTYQITSVNRQAALEWFTRSIFGQ